MLNTVLLFLNIGGSEMMLILLAALFLFGGKKLPELARGLGRGIREFKDASETIKRDINDQINSFGKDLDVSDSSANVNEHSSNATTNAVDENDYSDGGHRQPEYYGSEATDNGNASVENADKENTDDANVPAASVVDSSEKPTENDR